MMCLDEFGRTAESRANLLKSKIFILVRGEILQIMGFQVGVFPFRYLGILLASEKLCATNYNVLVDNISVRIGSWPKKTHPRD